MLGATIFILILASVLSGSDSKECKDKVRACKYWIAAHGCDKYSALMRHACAKSCNLCDKQIQSIITHRRKKSGIALRGHMVCKDKHRECRYWRYTYGCGDVMRSACPESCFVCDTPFHYRRDHYKTFRGGYQGDHGGYQGDCKDSPSVGTHGCESYKAQNLCERKYFQSVCPKTCGVCDSGDEGSADTEDKEDCKDSPSFGTHRCEGYKEQNLCSSKYFQSICPKTCGVCDSSDEDLAKTEDKEGCQDSASARLFRYCPVFKRSNLCYSSGIRLRSVCAKTCGMC